MNDYFLGLYEKSMPNSFSLRDKLMETKKAGFDFLEISIDETDEKIERLQWSMQERLDLVKAIYETQTKIMTMCLSGHRKYPIGSEDKDTRNRGMEVMSQAIDLASDIGIRVIQIAGYDEYYRESNQNTARFFSENLKASVKMAAKKGVILAFETMETEFINTIKKAMYHVTYVKSPYLQIYPDLGNITNAAKKYGSQVREDLTEGRGHIVAMHLKETSPGKFREIPYGTGHVDFKAGIRSARDMGVNLFVGEFWYCGNENWRRDLIAANSFLRKNFD